ncbi:MAG: TldD/PmbA family protein [Microthrixaceae bacterium]|nr:TldD/PmbA family protein [Microthrixaceae bacterium]
MTDDLLAVAVAVAGSARNGEQVDVMMSRGRSTSVKVFGGEVESFTSAQSSGVGVRVILDGRVGFAHAGSLDADVVAEVLRDARDNVQFSQFDEWVGLAEPDGVDHVAHLQWNDDLVSMDPAAKIAAAIDLERRTCGLDPRVTGVRTAAWSDGAGEVAYASSEGIAVLDRGTSCSIGVQPLARDGDETQIGSAGDAARSAGALDPERVARDAVERATRLLGGAKPASGRLAIVLEPRLVGSLLGLVSGMLDGDSVLKGRSPFAGRVGEKIASPLLSVADDPTRSESLGAESWDGEGLACRRNPLISGGVLDGFLHNSYTARRSATSSTGSAMRGPRSLPGVGARVLVMEPGERSFEQLVESVDLGLFVGSFAGLHSGVNPVSGDFSVGVDGVMIRGGSLAEAVREATIASTLQRLLLDVVEIGGDAEWLPSGDYLASMVVGDIALSGA